jgi:NAD(P)-dependent dehydrogenase (short-subunit alcohol dehydrogenase family)
MSAAADVKLVDFKNIFSLEGKVAVVTGGSRGLGLHAASGYVFLNDNFELDRCARKIAMEHM